MYERLESLEFSFQNEIRGQSQILAAVRGAVLSFRESPLSEGGGLYPIRTRLCARTTNGADNDADRRINGPRRGGVVEAIEGASGPWVTERVAREIAPLAVSARIAALRTR